MNFFDYTSEPDFELTLEGLIANKKFLIEQRELENPNYKYKGNCTKKYADKVVDAYFNETWNWIKSNDLPSGLEKPYTISRLENEIKSLIKNNNSWKTQSPLVRKFHDNTFRNSNRDGCLTPIQFWKKLQIDEILFKSFYHNRLRCSDWFNEKDKSGKYIDNKAYLPQGYVPPFIWAIGLNTSRKCPLVSLFKPSLAKYLTVKYLNEFSEVYDPFSGLSGRLLGVVATNKKYIGRDINRQAISESHDLMNFAEPVFKANGIEPKWSIEYSDALTTKGKYECVLMCPPYGKIEQWCGISSDIKCDDWIDIITSNIVAKRYVAVVDDTIEKYKDFIVESLDNFSHLGTNFEKVIVIDK